MMPLKEEDNLAPQWTGGAFCFGGCPRLTLRSAVHDFRQENGRLARDCVRLAQFVNDPVIRERLLQMAREWMAALMHEEKAPEPKSPFAQ
jgi:hypothetical protein